MTSESNLRAFRPPGLSPAERRGISRKVNTQAREALLSALTEQRDVLRALAEQESDQAACQAGALEVLQEVLEYLEAVLPMHISTRDPEVAAVVEDCRTLFASIVGISAHGSQQHAQQGEAAPS